MKEGDNFITLKSLKSLMWTTIIALIIGTGVVFLDVHYGKKYKIIDYAATEWITGSVILLIFCIIICLTIQSKFANSQPKVKKKGLYLYAFFIAFFAFCLINCSGYLYSPFLSLYSLIFIGAINITDSKGVIIAIMVAFLIAVCFHLYKTLIDRAESFIEINNCEYQVKYGIITVLILFLMLLIELIPYLSKKKEQKQKKEQEQTLNNVTNA